MSIRLFNPSGGFIDLNAGGDGTAANTFTLPAETGTLITTAGVPKAALPAGSVLQVVQATNSTGYTGTTGAETALFNFSVTPLFASSKIAIFVSLAAAATGTKTNYALTFRLRRGTTTAGTLIQNIRYGQFQAGGSAARELYAPVPLYGLDSPATTSSQSYCITIENIDGTPDYIVNGNGQTNIIFMEIAA
jgi:hypothetical protein